MDDPFISCPYNKIHRVPRSRIQRHIVKCPDKKPNYVACPYDATHLMPEDDIIEHTQDCPSKISSFPDDRPPVVTAAIAKPKPFLQSQYLPETDPNHEIWDD